MAKLAILTEVKKNRQDEILAQLAARPNLQQFLRHWVSKISLNALQEIVNFAKAYMGDINPAHFTLVSEKIAGKKQETSIRLPTVMTGANLRKFPEADRDTMRMLFWAIYYFYEVKAASQ